MGEVGECQGRTEHTEWQIPELLFGRNILNGQYKMWVILGVALALEDDKFHGDYLWAEKPVGRTSSRLLSSSPIVTSRTLW